MKKTISIFVLLLSFFVLCAATKDSATFHIGLGYDVRSVKELGDKSHSMAVEVGIRYPLGEGLSVYTDYGFRFVGGGQVGYAKIQKGLFGTSTRVGLLYGLRFKDHPEFETYIGGGISYANTSFSKQGRSFYNVGVGLKIAEAYRFSDSFALAFTVLPDLYFLNRSSFKVGMAATATLGTMFKF